MFDLQPLTNQKKNSDIGYFCRTINSQPKSQIGLTFRKTDRVRASRSSYVAILKLSVRPTLRLKA